MGYRKPEPSIIQKLLRSRFVQAFLLVLIAILSTQVFEQYQNASMTNERRQQSEADFYQRDADRQQLADQVSALHDSYVIEAEIRRHFDVAKEGEDVVIILDPPPEESSNNTADTRHESTKRPWYRFW